MSQDKDRGCSAVGAFFQKGAGSVASRKEEFAENKFNTVEQSVPLKCVLQPEQQQRFCQVWGLLQEQFGKGKSIAKFV